MIRIKRWCDPVLADDGIKVLVCRFRPRALKKQEETWTIWKKDLGTTQLPPLDTPLTAGDLGWHYHTGGHSATPADWNAFLQFVGKYF